MLRFVSLCGTRLCGCEGSGDQLQIGDPGTCRAREAALGTS